MLKREEGEDEERKKYDFSSGTRSGNRNIVFSLRRF